MEEKLPVCRICLVQNVLMYVVGNKNLHELYEKLTDIPFVTQDSRPILACFVCCAQLKKCYLLLTKCRKAEERFAQIMNGNYESKPLLNEDHLEIFHGFINSPIQSLSIVEDGLIESIDVKEELQAVCEGLDDIIELNEEHSSDDEDLKTVNLYDNYLDIEEIQLRSHHSESDSEEELPFLGFETEVVEEPEVSEKKQKAKEKNRTPVAKKLKLDTRITKLEDTIRPEIEKVAPEIIQNTQNTKPRVQNSINNIALDTNCRTNSDQDLKPLKCDTCHSSFRQKSDITKHIRIHTGEKPFKCEICQRSFGQKCNLTKHIRIHTGEKPFKCDVCQRSFRTNENLKTHIQIHTGEKPFKCDVCQSSFNCNKILITHIRIHTGEKPFKCEICQRSFGQKSNLTKHIRIHTGEKPFKCDVCQRSFSCNKILKTHIRIHTGEKPFKCEICQRSFGQKSTLTKHIRIHTGEKPFKCDVCQRSFRTNGNLKTHIRIHTGEKPFKCEICQRSFGQMSTLTKHIRIHTDTNN